MVSSSVAAESRSLSMSSDQYSDTDFSAALANRSSSPARTVKRRKRRSGPRSQRSWRRCSQGSRPRCSCCAFDIRYDYGIKSRTMSGGGWIGPIDVLCRMEDRELPLCKDLMIRKGTILFLSCTPHDGKLRGRRLCLLLASCPDTQPNLLFCPQSPTWCSPNAKPTTSKFSVKHARGISYRTPTRSTLPSPTPPPKTPPFRPKQNGPPALPPHNPHPAA